VRTVGCYDSMVNGKTRNARSTVMDLLLSFAISNCV
jgi:hypothetical protein